MGPLAVPGGEAIIDTRDFAVIPMVGLQESFTDNVLLTSTNQQYDFITRPMVGADMFLRGGPVTATVSGHVFYDIYARNGSLDGLSGDATGTGSYSLIPSFLSIDADGMVTNGETSTFGVPVLNRVGTANQVQVATYDIGPHLTTTIDDFADLNAVARFGQVLFDNPTGSTTGIPTDATILQGDAVLDTAQRFVGYQSVTTADAEKDDHGFQAYDAQESLYVRLLPDLRILGRGGYDNVYQAGVVNISAPIWFGGFEYTINQQSRITVERGERYNHVAWAGELHLQLSDALYADGHYEESLQPQQLLINSQFLSFAAPTTPPAIQLNVNNFSLNGNLNDQTALNKIADLHLVYRWDIQQIELQAFWNDRLLLSTNTHDRSLESGINYQRSVAPDLAVTASAAYWRTFSNPLFGQSELYNVELGLQYEMNPTMRLIGGYAFQRQQELFAGGATINENVAFVAVGKRF